MKTKLLVLSYLFMTGMVWGQKQRVSINGSFQGNYAFSVEAFTEFDNRTKYQRTEFLVTNNSGDDVEVQIETAITYTCGRVENGFMALTGGQTLRLKPGEGKKTGTWLKETMDEKCVTIESDGRKNTIVGITYSGVVLKNNSAKSNSKTEKGSEIADNTSQNTQSQVNITQNQSRNSTNKQTQAQQQANDIIAKIQREQQERERQNEIQAQQITEATTELVQLGTAMFEGIAADREAKRKKEAERKSILEKSLSSQFEKATQGDDQSYYDIFRSYKDAGFKQDANRFKDLAYLSGNSSVFEERNKAYKLQKKLDNKDTDGICVGLQYGLFSTYGISIMLPSNEWGLVMMFRSNFKEGSLGGYELSEMANNRGVYIDDMSDIQGGVYRYTFLEEGNQKQFARTAATIGASRLIKFPFYLYATVGYGVVGQFSIQKKEELLGANHENSKDLGVIEIEETIESVATEFGTIVKLNRNFFVNAGISMVKLKYPEVVFGININLFNPSSVMKD